MKPVVTKTLTLNWGQALYLHGAILDAYKATPDADFRSKEARRELAAMLATLVDSFQFDYADALNMGGVFLADDSDAADPSEVLQ